MKKKGGKKKIRKRSHSMYYNHNNTYFINRIKMLQSHTCFEKRAAVIAPPERPPVLTISATPDFIDSQ